MFGDMTIAFRTNGDSMLVEIRATDGDYVNMVAGIFGGAVYLHAHGGGWTWDYIQVDWQMEPYESGGKQEHTARVQEKHQDGGVELVYAWLKLARSFKPQQVEYEEDFMRLVDKRLTYARKPVHFGDTPQAIREAPSIRDVRGVR